MVPSWEMEHTDFRGFIRIILCLLHKDGKRKGAFHTEDCGP